MAKTKDIERNLVRLLESNGIEIRYALSGTDVLGSVVKVATRNADSGLLRAAARKVLNLHRVESGWVTTDRETRGEYVLVDY